MVTDPETMCVKSQQAVLCACSDGLESCRIIGGWVSTSISYQPQFQPQKAQNSCSLCATVGMAGGMHRVHLPTINLASQLLTAEPRSIYVRCRISNYVLQASLA
jgi:hypothetical protein